MLLVITAGLAMILAVVAALIINAQSLMILFTPFWLVFWLVLYYGWPYLSRQVPFLDFDKKNSTTNSAHRRSVCPRHRYCLLGNTVQRRRRCALVLPRVVSLVDRAVFHLAIPDPQAEFRFARIGSAPPAALVQLQSPGHHGNARALVLRDAGHSHQF
jgi:hypothetical protein